MRTHNPLDRTQDIFDTFTPAQRFVVLIRRSGPPAVATGERNVRLRGPLTEEVLRHIDAAAHILRNEVDFFKITPQYIYITLMRKETEP